MSLQCTISYRANVLIADFNEEMSTTGDHSAIYALNYAITDGVSLEVLPYDTTVEVFNKNRVKFTLPYYFAHYLQPQNYLQIGFIDRKNFRYVTNVFGDVYNVCDSLKIGFPIPTLNIADGYGYLIDSNSIYYKYTGPNEFLTVYADDFYATVNGTVTKPFYVEKLSSNEFKFVFYNSPFNENDLVYLGVFSNPKTTDIYGLPIEGNSTLKIRTVPKPSLVTVSLSNIDNTIGNRAYLILMFNESIKDFYADDFAAVYEGKLFSIVYEGINHYNRTAFEVWIDLETYLTFPVKDITLFTNVPDEDIRTRNYENTPINPVLQNKAKTFTANSLTWQADDNSLKENIINIYFDSPLDYGTFITNSHFDSDFLPWDGSDITVPSGAIIFTKGIDSDSLSLNFNPSFGFITITPKTGTNFINNTITNSSPALIKASLNKISIIFSAAENSEAYPMNINTFKYRGTKFVISQNSYFLCYGYEPNGILLLRDIIFVPPMDNINDNPFTGGYQNPSYILKVDNNHSYRTYGNPIIRTTVGGFIRVDGPIDIGEEITLTNIKILGTLYIKVGSGTITLDNTDASNIKYE